MEFSDLGLSLDLVRRVAEVGYQKPTPIQEQAIPHILQGRDILGCAQTGTGKTASFTLPMIDILASGRAKARMPRSLILEPTRELAAQVATNFETMGRDHKLSMALLIGGESFTDQIKKLDRGVDVLIGTPGRLIDLFERGNILLSDIKIFVIDEADRMLDMGFIPDIERIVSLLPRIRQTLFFSATMPTEIRRLADAFLVNPREITVAPPASPAETVDHRYALVYEGDKRKVLRQLLRVSEVRNALIFCNRKKDVSHLAQSLERHGFNVGALHGDMPQVRRTATLEGFKDGRINLLVCSDVAARGLDIAGLSHVFNFDVPINPEDYVHRIGRTGRAGRSGQAVTLATGEDGKQIAAIAKLISRDIPRIDVSGFDSPSFEDDDEVRPARKGRSGGKHKSKDRRKDRDGAGNGRTPASEPAERLGASAFDAIPDRPFERLDTPPSTAAGSGRRGEDRPARRRQRDFSSDEPDQPVVGFGDHVPEFLKRPARPA